MDIDTTGNPVVLADGPIDPTTTRGTVWLPIVVNNQLLAPIPLAQQFFNLMWGDSRRQRPELSLCPCLTFAAAARAKGLASGDPWAHVDANGITPHEYARQYGCVLPDYYPTKGNFIESLAAGSNNMEVMFNALANSPSHADHIFGRTPFFRAQGKCGIGVAQGGQYGWYLCVLISECL